VGVSLHNMMLPHRPDVATLAKASTSTLEPVKLTNTMAFMLETRFPQHVTRYAAALQGCRRTTAVAGRGY
jgi:homogentisate 1,2-dioxygenase